ncbi:MAG TPA: hypothetical protein VFH74_13845 [Gaiellales bacterium]|nr:hypothetical protein [Gaiellales bacterium]
MADPGIVLAGGIGAGALLLAGARTRRGVRGPDRIPPEQLGLERIPPLGAFVQYSVPGNPACRVSLNRLAAEVAPHRGRATVVELHDRPPAGVGVPTVLYVDRTGAVVRRWSRPPAREELAALLGPAPISSVRAGRCSPAAVR